MSYLNIAFDQYASHRHCNALHFGNKPTVSQVLRNHGKKFTATKHKYLYKIIIL